MFVGGHLGTGLAVAWPWWRKIVGHQTKPEFYIFFFSLFFGTLLPDLIDKPLYYGMSWWNGLRGSDLGLISGTRTIGHCAFLMSFVFFLGVLKSNWRPYLWPLCLGWCSHLIIDLTGDAIYNLINPAHPSSQLVQKVQNWEGMLFPLFGWDFPDLPFKNASDHLKTFGKIHIWTGELLGWVSVFLFWKKTCTKR